MENHTATLNSLTSILMCFTLHTKWWESLEEATIIGMCFKRFSNESPQAEIPVKMRFSDWNVEALTYVTRASFGDFKCPSQLANLRVNVIGWEKGEWAVLCPLGKVYEKPADVK